MTKFTKFTCVAVSALMLAISGQAMALEAVRTATAGSTAIPSSVLRNTTGINGQTLGDTIATRNTTVFALPPTTVAQATAAGTRGAEGLATATNHIGQASTNLYNQVDTTRDEMIHNNGRMEGIRSMASSRAAGASGGSGGLFSGGGLFGGGLSSGGLGGFSLSGPFTNGFNIPGVNNVLGSVNRGIYQLNQGANFINGLANIPNAATNLGRNLQGTVNNTLGGFRVAGQNFNAAFGGSALSRRTATNTPAPATAQPVVTAATSPPPSQGFVGPPP